LSIALARTCGLSAVERGVAGYIALFQGTPLLMQLFVVYYGLALLGLKLEAWVAVAIGFTLHASAFLGKIWRGSLQAIPRGETEAAKALSLGYGARMSDLSRQLARHSLRRRLMSEGCAAQRVFGRSPQRTVRTRRGLAAGRA